MERILSVLLLVILSVLTVSAKGDKLPQYDLTGAGSGNEGMILLKVYVYAKSASDEDLKRCAVHGIVFRGCTGNNSGARQPAMTSPDNEASHQSYCDAFFASDGECQNYASVIAGSYERVNTQKGYKCGAIVQVNKKALRKTLEKAGVVRSLSSGF